jgi:hypothetical protein
MKFFSAPEPCHFGPLIHSSPLVGKFKMYREQKTGLLCFFVQILKYLIT